MMSVTETLFGGVLLIAILFGLLSLLRVSVFWRGIISSILPLGAYLAYAFRNWPGGDVLTVHVTVYMAVATVLSLIAARPRTSTKLHWGPALMIAFFVVLVVIQAFFLMISSRGLPPWLSAMVMPGHKPIHTAFSGVVPHDEQAAKTISQYLNTEEKRKQLGWQVAVDGLETVVTGKDHPVRLVASQRGQAPLTGAAVSATIVPLVGGVIATIPLPETSPGTYAAHIDFPSAGQYKVDLTVRAEGHSYEVTRSVTVSET